MRKNPYTHHPFRQCNNCDGQGWIHNLMYRQIAPWVDSPEKTLCVACGGKGYI